MKSLKKFLSVVLCVLMLSAMAIPSMAEGEVTIYNTNSMTDLFYETFDTFTASVQGTSVEKDGENSVLKLQNLANDTAVFIGNNSKNDAVTDYVYEAGFKIKLTNPGVKDNILRAYLVGENENYPITKNLMFKSYVSHDNDYRLLRSNDKVADRNSGLVTDGKTWNEIKVVVTESSTSDSVSYDIYLNGIYVYSRSEGLGNTKSPEVKNPYRWKFFFDTNSVSADNAIYLDDLYIKKYSKVTSIDTSASAVKIVDGQTDVATLFNTVNVNVDGTSTNINVVWESIGETTATGKSVDYIYAEGDANLDRQYVPITVALERIEFPYEVSINGNNLLMSKLTEYTPEAKVYGAVYENGLLTDVQILGTVSDSTEWTDGKKALPLDEGKTYRAFIVNDELVPYAISTELN